MPRNHVIDFSNAASRLSISLGRLNIESKEFGTRTIPMEEIAVLIVSHPQVLYSQAVLSGLMEAGGAFVTCAPNHLPNGLLLPLAGNGTQTERFAAQSAASLPICKRLWKQIVQCKIASQASVLSAIHGDDGRLTALIPLVKSGDPSNVEARAARRYWSRLFRHQSFRRDFDTADENAFLNYGYAVLRAIVGRAICGAGLHPTIGLHHHNRYNPFCLADDLMEPFRPIVDLAVYHATRAESEPTLTSDAKRKLVGQLCGKIDIGGEQRTIFDLASQVAGSLADVFLTKRGDLNLPSFDFCRVGI